MMDPSDWPDCECGRWKVCMWAGEGKCHSCTAARLGWDEMNRRYRATRADDGSWAGWESTLAALGIIES